MKLLLLRPNLGDYRSTDAMPPLAMGILAARSPGWDVRFHDEKAEPLPLDAPADLVALSVETFTARRAYEVARAYRSRGVPVVMGGYHPTFLPDEALEHADAVVIGDAEGAWEQLLQDARAGRLQRRYQGSRTAPLADYRVERGIFRGKRYAPVELVQFGRGCRFACDFCSIHAFYGTSVRVRPLDGLVREIESLPARRLLFFVDDNLFSSEAELTALLDAMQPLRRRWSCQISIDVARNPRLLDRLAEAGCRFVLIGFESLHPDNLKQMAKPWNKVSGPYRDVVRGLHARGIGIYGTFVFGYDADTPDTIARTVDFALESRLEIANFNALTPTPGSALYDRLRDEGRLTLPKWWLDPGYRYGDPIFEPRGMAAAELAQGVFEARRRFYGWGSIARRVFSSEVPWSTFRVAMTGIANTISRREIYKKQFRPLGT
ncbi:MAG TPA: radical SAM protein [Ramlibacter sp.]|nr:radical SAM protein [Ramlibacter sp.]